MPGYPSDPARGTMRHQRSWLVLVVGIGLVVSLAGETLAYPRPGSTRLVTVATDGKPAPMPLVAGVGDFEPASSISANGRFVAFASDFENLVPGDTNAAMDVFVRDLKRGRTELVSSTTSGSPAVGLCFVSPDGSFTQTGSGSPAISGNGRHIAFESCASNLVPGDTNNVSDVFVADRITGAIERVSVTSDGAQSNDAPTKDNISISHDGRFVAWSSYASNLVPGDTNNNSDVFVRDRQKNETERVSVSSSGAQSEGGISVCPSLSGDGRSVAFASWARNLIPLDTNAAGDVFVRDLTKDTTELVSRASDGSAAATSVQGSDTCSNGEAVSHDGRYIAFRSAARNLVPGDRGGAHTNIEHQDIFVRDLKQGRTDRVSVDSMGQEGDDYSYDASLSGNGRYVAFVSTSNDLVGAEDTGKYPAGSGDSDAFVYDRVLGSLHWLTKAGDGSEGKDASGTASASNPSVSDNGRMVSFTDTSENLVGGDENLWWDIFVRDIGPALGSSSASARPGGSERQAVCLATRCLDADRAVAIADNRADTRTIGRHEAADLRRISLAHRAPTEDLLLGIDVERLARLSEAPDLLYGARFSARGVDYEIRIEPGGELTDGGSAAIGLFVCDAGSCTETERLHGGYGTTGERIVASIPLASIGFDRGGRLEGLFAFSSFGSYLEGPHLFHDEVHTNGAPDERSNWTVSSSRGSALRL